MTLIVSGLAIRHRRAPITARLSTVSNNEPLIGATIMPVRGGERYSNRRGRQVHTQCPGECASGEGDYVGYNAQTVTLQNNMTIHLHSTSSDLDDVVVVAPTVPPTSESLTGSVAVVGSKGDPKTVR